jgi:ferredoxin
VKKSKDLLFPLAVFLFVAAILCIIQIQIENPLLLAERFVKNGGWFEIIFISLYGAFVASKMRNAETAPKWRIISWTVFSVVFFSQLLLGILYSDKFLMSGKLHLPIPAMILSGPIYRGQLSIMTVLFISTVVLTGPAWCSHLCYFGAMDAWFSRSHITQGKLSNKMRIKYSLLILIVCTTLLLRWFKIDTGISTLVGIAFGIIGIAIMVFLSRKKGIMIHCIMYCPIGTLVNYFKFINPFRMYIDSNCTFCESCISVCKYDALSLKDLNKKKPGISCTLCGDCLSVCHMNSLKYRLFKFNPEISRNLYLFITISIHSIFLALARI